jgi:hypothetical protein
VKVSESPGATVYVTPADGRIEITKQSAVTTKRVRLRVSEALAVVDAVHDLLETWEVR